jgi:hypothetical protein
MGLLRSWEVVNKGPSRKKGPQQAQCPQDLSLGWNGLMHPPPSGAKTAEWRRAIETVGELPPSVSNLLQ